tara:strand:+ start:9162 stop:9497 length:336 start_codon:yes stop_codon:yes gene_type:complete
MVLDITSPSTFITEVSTFSISTLKKSTIKLKVVYIDGNFFITRRNKESGWYKNLLSKNVAEIKINEKTFYGNAKELTDEKEIETVSSVKYKNNKKYEKRFGFKIKLLGEAS